jgi:hypothetical protein
VRERECERERDHLRPGAGGGEVIKMNLKELKFNIVDQIHVALFFLRKEGC